MFLLARDPSFRRPVLNKDGQILTLTVYRRHNITHKINILSNSTSELRLFIQRVFPAELHGRSHIGILYSLLRIVLRSLAHSLAQCTDSSVFIGHFRPSPSGIDFCLVPGAIYGPGPYVVRSATQQRRWRREPAC